jgi:peptidyl-prolyl cis-trans isomerase D
MHRFQGNLPGDPAMLNVMRDNLKNLKWVLWVVAISLTLFLGGGFFGNRGGAGGSGNWVARIDGTEVSISDFRTQLNRLDNAYRRIYGDSYEQFRSQIKLGDEALGVLVQQRLILADARRVGFSTDANDISAVIQNDPGFQTADGQFIGTDQYVTLINNNVPGGVAAFERSISDSVLIDRWNRLITDGVNVSDTEIERVFRERTEKTTINYLVVTSVGQQFEVDVTDAERRSWYDANPDLYQRPEGRHIRYILINRDSLPEEIVVTDAETQELYNANPTDYQRPEQRSARHILFRTEADASDDDRLQLREQAQGILDRLRAGEDFATLASANSQDPSSAVKGGDLGFFSRGQMVPAFDTAVFSLPVGELSDIVESSFGLHIIEVTGERQAGLIPFDEVKDSIRRTIEVTLTQNSVIAEADRLKGLITSAEDFDSAASSENVVVSSRFVAKGDQLRELGASSEFIAAIDDFEAGRVSAPLRVSSGMAILTVNEWIPAGLAPLGETEGQITTDILNDRARAMALTQAEATFANEGSLQATADALGLTIQDSGELAPGQNIPGTGDINSGITDVLFGEGVQEFNSGVVEVSSGAMIYQITARQPFDTERFETEKASLSQSVLDQKRERRRQSMLNRLYEELEIEVNRGIVDRSNG